MAGLGRRVPGFEERRSVKAVVGVQEIDDAGRGQEFRAGTVALGGVHEDAFALGEGGAGGPNAAAGLPWLDDAENAGQGRDGGVTGDRGVDGPGGVWNKLADNGGPALGEGLADGPWYAVGQQALGENDDGLAALGQGGEVGGPVNAAGAAAHDGHAVAHEELGAGRRQLPPALGRFAGADEARERAVQQSVVAEDE